MGLGLAGCEGSGSRGATLNSKVVPNQGVFLDSPVSGLDYQTETQSGTTDAAGHFQYLDGETIMFSMGDIVMGEAMASAVMTPVDLVPRANDETHPTVTNMIRFMQTLDEDGNPENGITLPPHLTDELRGRMIHFDMNIERFENNIDVQMLMDTLSSLHEAYAGRTMVSVETAQAHMRNAMRGMMHDGGL
ncbi:MAG: hypothetical protein Q8O72_05595 [Bacteroidales bacterium]|nr:hypothetical protein [Bacteroidales bacterium]